MLTDATKRKINNCRDTLVGKIPVPMSQIEQITLAMTYKFMSDIDAENSALGGTSFFEGEYAKYAWKNLMDKRNGAQERLNLYSEGLDSMSRNPHIPELFRDIFRNAYLPFKDPTTLDRFLKQIDEFHYGHSEELGNAFEYLLSTAGSQGDAGQFRTPRHIIDFLVAVVDPSRDDTILDPACGTAGFLISAYKHIIEQGGSSLTIEDKQNITRNITGYDISHDMVRLSLVNMYLHHFADPRIYEYDTLSMETRWNEEYSCILANPPFMTPKGGIEPHKRFSIRATKSEVLFVDYIMEHLSIHGKAGIIVPEGVIFQSGNAYKDLRKKMIVDNFLYAVVSLPSGIFQPYSGVKTSILFFDRQIAKKSDSILFVKVANDGYDLGAQRRKIVKNDLPEALEILKQYKESLSHPELVSGSLPLAHLVEKSRIVESGDYNLSGDRYRVSTNMANSDFEMVELEEVVDIKTGKKDVNEGNPEGEFPFFTCAKEHTFSDSYSFDMEALLVAGNGDVGAVKYYKGKFEAYQRTYILSNFQNILPQYLFQLLNSKLKETVSTQKLGNTMPYIKLGMLTEFKIPLPPLEIQEEIVAELDGYQRIIDGARQVVENYKPTIKIDPSWEMVELGEVCEIGSSKRVFESEWKTEGVPFYRAREIVKLANYGFVENELFITEEMYESYGKKYGAPKIGDLMVTGVGTLGICYLVKEEDRFYFKDGNIIWFKNFSSAVKSNYIKILFETPFIKNQIAATAEGGTVGTYTIINAKQTKIPLPPLEIQEQIVARIEAEQRLIDATKELIAIYEGKVKERISEVWGENNLSEKE